MLTKTIPAYVYLEYSDDVDIQAFNTNYNDMAQAYITWFATASLPIYTMQSGELLDWVANGLYGAYRPTLASTLTDDDVFQRCITWAFYKGDGKQFNIRWLKRRLQRWLNGVNGTDIGYISGVVNQTYQISVTFGAPNIVYINILAGIAEITSGEFNQNQFNTAQFNGGLSIQQYSNMALELQLQEAIDSGVLELPFQFTYIVNVTP